jgi:hypothetical protein
MPTDPLLQTLRTDDLENRSDRLHYATGEMLGQDDFRAEQLYHRRQLARALLFLHGSGTIAGLKVIAAPVASPTNPGAVGEVQIIVEAGLAIDRSGRLIELPVPISLRLRRWAEFISDPAKTGDPRAVDRLRNAYDAGANAVLADVFLTFHACERGWTPAFATGPFDALDASQPSRVRDSYQASLVLRSPGIAPQAFDPWATVPPGATTSQVHDAIFAAWTHLEPPPTGVPADFHETPASLDPNSVLLARLYLPAAAAPAAPADINWSTGAWNHPLDTAGDNVSNIDNSVRTFVVAPALLRRLHNL